MGLGVCVVVSQLASFEICRTGGKKRVNENLPAAQKGKGKERSGSLRRMLGAGL